MQAVGADPRNNAMLSPDVKPGTCTIAFPDEISVACSRKVAKNEVGHVSKCWQDQGL